jgi:hypothetical protein
MDTHRFLFREFKYEREPLDKAQLWVMRDLSALPRCTVWLLRRLDDGLIGWWDVSSERGAETLTIEEYRDRLHRWWYGESAISSTVIRQACLHRPEFIDNGVCWICSHAGVGAPFDR